MEVQIVHYIQDYGFNDRYNQISGPELHFKTFKYGPTRDYKIIRQGASMSIEYYHHRWHHITGLLPIKGLLNMYYGDIKGETCGIWVDPDGMHFSIAIIKGHQPKKKEARKKAVIRFITKQKNKG